MKALQEGRVCGDSTHFLSLLAVREMPLTPYPIATLTMPGTYPGLLLELGGYINKLGRIVFSHHKCFLN